MLDVRNGIYPDGEYITGNDPRDANVRNSLAFQLGWMKHLVKKWGTADNGGLCYYICDNEPSIWFDTYRDVNPKGTKMNTVKKILKYAAKI